MATTSSFSCANLDQVLLSQLAACMNGCERLIRVVSPVELLALTESVTIIILNYSRQRLHMCGQVFSMKSLFVRHMLFVYVEPHLGLKFLHSPVANKEQNIHVVTGCFM